MNYRSLNDQLDALLNTNDFLVNSAQFSAFIFDEIKELNWAGFYFFRDGILQLGSFQGKPACNPIPLGKGVCGSAAEKRESILVENVHEFPGHIACDAASNAELVIPLIKDDKLIGVFDMDSPKLSRFTEEDKLGLELLCNTYLNKTEFLYF
ncbi:MAG: GAF domain-containing protein [Bdellovibrionota bacterium]|nr:GAF domain-containing protein [Bdellovibrionota bacterium]